MGGIGRAVMTSNQHPILAFSRGLAALLFDSKEAVLVCGVAFTRAGRHLEFSALRVNPG